MHHSPQLLLPAALELYDRDVCVLPLRPRTKKAAVKWRQMQRSRASSETIRTWFADTDNLQFGLGVLLGKVSGGLICRDFDVQESYDRWKSRHPELAATLPTVKTRRGAHVYSRCPESDLERLRRPGRKGVSRKFRDGELRSDCHIAVMPPSLHEKTGEPYEWLIPMPGQIPTHPLDSLGFFEESDTVAHVVACATTPHSDLSAFSSPDHQANDLQSPRLQRASSLEEAISLTTPDGPGQRNQKIFEFARQLKAISQYSRKLPEQLHAEFAAWHREALPFIGTKDFHWNYSEFQRAWNDARIAAGTGSLANAVHRAKTNPLPKAAFRYTKPTMQLLVAVCKELQVENKGGPFFLSCRNAEKAMDIECKSPGVMGSRYLLKLCRDGVIRKVRKGSLIHRKADEYQYMVP